MKPKEQKNNKENKREEGKDDIIQPMDSPHTMVDPTPFETQAVVSTGANQTLTENTTRNNELALVSSSSHLGTWQIVQNRKIRGLGKLSKTEKSNAKIPALLAL